MFAHLAEGPELADPLRGDIGPRARETGPGESWFWLAISRWTAVLRDKPYSSPCGSKRAAGVY